MTDSDPNGPADPKIVKTVRKDYIAETEQEHFKRQIVKRPWS